MKRIGMVAALVVAVTGLVSPAARAEAPPAPLPAQVDYVALGDSYSAGPLVPTQRPDPFGCLRSFNNYPAYLSGFLGVTTYRDVTCSGAKTKDFWLPQDSVLFGDPPPPQLDALSADTDLVTIGIGGNDYGLFASMIATCEDVRDDDPDGAPCRDHFTTPRGIDTKSRDARRVEAHLVIGVEKVLRRAPNAQVYLVGYPRLIPEHGTCSAVPFAPGDYAWGNRVEKLLNRSIARAAARTGVSFVDLYPASRGHDACAGDAAWINGSVLDPTRAANFHPFQVGERQMGRVVYQAITGLTAPDVAGANAAPPPGSLILNTP